MSDSTHEDRPADPRVRGAGPQRAGLRIAHAAHEPTAVFAIVEMTVLVVVTALAMVSVIVASGGDDGSGRGHSSAASSHHAGFGNAVGRRTEAPRSSDDASSR